MKKVIKKQNILLWFSAIFFCLLLLLTATKYVGAQLSPVSVTVDVSPEIPGAFQNVTLTLISFVVDLDKAQIVWSTNGSVRLSGIGETEFSFTTGSIGSQTTVDISITTPAGGRIDKRSLIRVSEIDLLWEATDSYVPPFYKGKALPSSESSIKVVAIPSLKSGGVRLKPENLVYTWRRNFNTTPTSSGYGKSAFVFKHSYLNDVDIIDLSVSALDNGSRAEGRIIIRVGEPKIIFYENRPLEGVRYNSALNRGFTMRGNRVTIVAEPYFFSPGDPKSSDLDYEWSVNNSPIATPENKNSLVIERGERGGIARISLTLESLSKLFQQAVVEMRINLGT